MISAIQAQDLHHWSSRSPPPFKLEITDQIWGKILTAVRERDPLTQRPSRQRPPASLHGLTSGTVLFSSARRASAGPPGTPLDSATHGLTDHARRLWTKPLTA
uniref:Uncharacterized protein n=1 Tax=Fagus sylvatica TaxID=28930 RepID=A0A2N9G5R7_FAGSY